MPVKTRAQRLKEDDGSGATTLTTMSVPKKVRRKPRTSRRSTTSRTAKISSNTNTNKEDKEDKEDKEEREGKSEEATAYKSNVDEFRKYVKNILDSPNKIDLPSSRTRIQAGLGLGLGPGPGPSPRVERITIRNDDNQQMEFLIPPKQKDAPFEIRERIRAALSPDEKPQTVPFIIPNTNTNEEKCKSKSPSYPPVYNEGSQLWSPHPQMYDQQEAERISRWLIILIFSILTAVVFACYQHEIVTFLKSQLTPIGQSLNQGRESILCCLQGGWSSILKMVSGVSDVVTQTDNAVDDTVTK